MHLSIPYYTTLVERLARVLPAGGLLVMAESEPTYVSYPCPIVSELTYSYQRQDSLCTVVYGSGMLLFVRLMLLSKVSQPVHSVLRANV
jgi:hypothetical protein